MSHSALPVQPWWRFRIVWLVLSGPAVVVVAALATAVIAVRNIDPVLDTEVVVKHGRATSEAPALQARNHAATSNAHAAP